MEISPYANVLINQSFLRVIMDTHWLASREYSCRSNNVLLGIRMYRHLCALPSCEGKSKCKISLIHVYGKAIGIHA